MFHYLPRCDRAGLCWTHLADVTKLRLRAIGSVTFGGKSMLYQRVAFGLLALIAVIAMVLADIVVTREVRDVAGPVGDLLRCGSIIPLTVTALLLLGARELGRFFTLAGAQPQRRFAFLMVGVMGLSPWFSAAGWLGRSAEQVEGLYRIVVPQHPLQREVEAQGLDQAGGDVPGGG